MKFNGKVVGNWAEESHSGKELIAVTVDVYGQTNPLTLTLLKHRARGYGLGRRVSIDVQLSAKKKRGRK